MGEPLVIAVTSGEIWTDVTILAGALLGKDLGTHGQESTGTPVKRWIVS